MTRWNPKEIEAILGCTFSVLDWEHPFQPHEAMFKMGGIHYCLFVCPVTELVWLRADAANPDQATPHFEFSFRCDRIRTGGGGYDSEAIFFDFSDGDENVDMRTHCRLVMDRLPNGNLYTWPIIGASDPVLDVEQLRSRANKGEHAGALLPAIQPLIESGGAPVHPEAEERSR